MNNDNRTRTALRIAAISEPSDELLGRLLAEYPDDETGYAMALVEIETGNVPDEYTEGLQRWQPRILPDRELDRMLGLLEEHGIGVLFPFDDAYPIQLHDLHFTQPRVLFYRGNALALAGSLLAVVGARAATEYGTLAARQFADYFIKENYTVVSGGAYGIDGAAHREALAAGGQTVAVLAGGLDRMYPAGHDELLQRIPANGGVLVSENAPGMAPTKWRFLARNRIIAALSEAVVVIEAGARSGSLNTAAHARKISGGRPVYAVPGPITSPSSAGTHLLIHEGHAKIAAHPNWVTGDLA